MGPSSRGSLCLASFPIPARSPLTPYTSGFLTSPTQIPPAFAMIILPHHTPSPSEPTPYPVCRLSQVTVAEHCLHSTCARLTLLELQGGCIAKLGCTWPFWTGPIMRVPLPRGPTATVASQPRTRTGFRPWVRRATLEASLPMAATVDIGGLEAILPRWHV